MLKIISTVTPQRFEKFGVILPKTWNVTYVLWPYSEQELSLACRNADYLFVGSVDPVSAKVIQENKHLKLIQTEGVSFDKVDVDAAKDAGIPVCNNKAVNAGAVAEHIIGLMLAGLRRTVDCHNTIFRSGYEEAQKQARIEGEHELGSRHVGLIGFGAIGRNVAKRLIGWDCKVSYYDPFRPTPEVEKELNVSYLPLEELYSCCDVISLQLAVLPTTRGMVNEKAFRSMRPETILVNAARGEIIDQDALCSALIDGCIYAACLDTVTPEPAPSDLPLLNLPEHAKRRLIVTPHIAGTTDEAFSRMLEWSIDNISRVERGEPPINQVNV